MSYDNYGLKTVIVKDADAEGGYVIINAEDVTAEHEVLDKIPEPKAAAKKDQK